MLQHAKAQGFAPHNADKLIMFLNLELQERAAGRVIDLQSEQSACAPPYGRPQAPEQPTPPVRAAALESGKREAGAVKQAPAFSSGTAASGAGAAHARSNAAGSARVASAPSAQPLNSAGSSASSDSGAAARSDAGSQGLRDRPWNRKKKAALSEGFTIGENGRMEVCFISSSASNKRKPAKKKLDVSDQPVPKPVRRQGLCHLPPALPAAL